MALSDRRNYNTYLGYRVMLDLQRPCQIHCRRLGRASSIRQVQGQVGHVECLAIPAERETRRKTALIRLARFALVS